MYYFSLGFHRILVNHDSVKGGRYVTCIMLHDYVMILDNDNSVIIVLF